METGRTAVTANNSFGCGLFWVRPAILGHFGTGKMAVTVGGGFGTLAFPIMEKKRNIQIFENPKNEKTEITKFPFADQNFELCFWRNLLPSPAFPAPLFFSVVFNWEKVAWLIVHQNAWDLSIAGTCECKSPIISISEGKCWTTYKFFSISWNEIQEIEKHLKFFSISWNEIQEIEKHL